MDTCQAAAAAEAMMQATPPRIHRPVLTHQEALRPESTLEGTNLT